MLQQNDQSDLYKDIADLKKEMNDMSYKIDLILEILNNFTIMLSEEDEEVEDYDSDESWVPKEDEFWEDDNDESI